MKRLLLCSQLVLVCILIPISVWATDDRKLMIDARTWKNPQERQIILSVLDASSRNEKAVEAFYQQQRFAFVHNFRIRAIDLQGKEVFNYDQKGKVKVVEGKIEYEPLEEQEKLKTQEPPRTLRENGNNAVGSVNEVIPPFLSESHAKYRYLYLGAGALNGNPVHKVQFYPVTSHPKLIKGVAYFDQGDFHMIQMEAQMVQNPPLVSLGSGVIKFAKIREGIYLFKEMRVKGVFGFWLWKYNVEMVSGREGITFLE